MNELNQALLILHFIGLAMGLAVPFSNMALQGLVAKASPPERAVLARFSPAMSRVGDIGLVLLWVTGLLLVFTKWGGFGVLPWQFHVKITAVVILTGLVGYIHTLMRKARAGDTAAAARVPAIGRLAFLAGLTAVVFAVLTFD
jgi:predicted ferric reductase